jgi:hypothetical protein
MTHNMTPCKGFTLFGSFLNFLCPFQTILKTAGMKLLSPGLSLAKLEVDLWWNSMLWTYKWFFKKFTSIISFTCSSNLGTLLPIRKEFVFFMRDGRKGFGYTDWEFVHLRWSSIFGKMGWYQCQILIWWFLHRTPWFWHLKNGNWLFRASKRKTSSCNIVSHPKMHMFAQYGHIITNYF